MADVLTFTNPEQNYSAGGTSGAVPVAFFSIAEQLGAVSILVCMINVKDVATYQDEDADSTNPVMLKSTVSFARDGTEWFVGEVVAKPVFKSFRQGTFIEVTIHGPDGVANKTLCRDSSGNDLWTVATTTYSVTNVPLEVSNDYGSFVGSTLWPDPTDATIGAKCWVQDSDSRTDTTSTEILIGATAPFYVEFSTTDKGMNPRGWLKFVNGPTVEFMYYDGLDDTGTGGAYRAKVTARACLGTSAAAWSIGSTVYEKIAKRIAPGTIIVTEDGTRLRLNKQVFPQYGLGCFLLSSTAGGTTYVGEEYSVYDEDQVLDPTGSTALIEDIASTMLQGAYSVGGPGFSAGDINFDSLGLAVTRYDYNPKKKPAYVLPAIFELLETDGLGDVIKCFYDQPDEWRLTIPSNGSVARTLSAVHRIEKDVDIEDVYSAVRLEYVDDQPSNRVHEDRSNHVGAAASGAKPDFWVKTTAGGESWDFGTNTQDTGAADSNFGVDVLRDGNPATKLTAEFEHDVGGDFVFCEFWFGDGTTPPLINLDKIGIRVGNYRVIEDWGRTTVNDDYTYVVKLQGSDDYNSSTKVGTWQDLGFVIEGKPQVDGVPKLHEASAFTMQAVNAIRIVFEYIAGRKEYGDFYRAAVHDFIVEGSTVKYVYVQTSDTEQANSAYVYAPNAHAKLRGGIGAASAAGAPRVLHVPSIGAATEDAAITIARKILKTKLAVFQGRRYEYRGKTAASEKPHLVDTWTVTEATGVTYTGWIRAYRLTKSANASGGISEVLNLQMESSAVGTLT